MESTVLGDYLELHPELHLCRYCVVIFLFDRGPG